MLSEFPRPLASIVGEILGEHYYHHQTIETLLYECGASGEVPEGSCTKKISSWLLREGESDVQGAISLIGKILEDFMDGDISRQSVNFEQDKERVKKALAR